MGFQRIYAAPNDSFFLFGPRGVGKSTFVRDQLKPSLSINLLEASVYLELKRDPSRIQALLAPARGKARILIDEIQKLPILLDEVQNEIESRGRVFVLTGSSARKLKRSGVNLLAGRAVTRRMFPFSLHELNGAFPIQRLLQIGTVPLVLGREPEAEEVLISYVDTYLKEEIREEALTRNLEDFVRFLEISGQLNGRILNFENLAAATGRSGDTVKKWYGILEDTLLGTTVPAFRPGFKAREATHGKFYYFDPGVARAAAGLIREPLEEDGMARGFALETLVLNELRIRNETSRHERKISFYGVPGSEEIDFIVETRKKTIDRPGRFVTIEVKASKRWRSEFEAPSRSLQARSAKSCEAMLGVYLGKDELSSNGFRVLPVQKFADLLQTGKLI